jgi:hypothetical protein
VVTFDWPSNCAIMQIVDLGDHYEAVVK